MEEKDEWHINIVEKYYLGYFVGSGWVDLCPDNSNKDTVEYLNTNKIGPGWLFTNKTLLETIEENNWPQPKTNFER